MGIFFGVGERRRTGGTLVLKGFQRRTIARKPNNWVETTQVRFKPFSMFYLMFNSWWFSDGSGHLFCWLVWTERTTNCCVEVGSLSVCYVLHYVNAIDSIRKKFVCGSIFEIDAWNHAPVWVQILFRIVSLILARGSILETRLSLCSLVGIFCLFPGFLLCFYPYSLFRFSHDLLVPICISGCVLGRSFTLEVSKRVRADSSQHLSARYCPLMPFSRSTTTTTFSPDEKNK